MKAIKTVRNLIIALGLAYSSATLAQSAEPSSTQQSALRQPAARAVSAVIAEVSGTAPSASGVSAFKAPAFIIISVNTEDNTRGRQAQKVEFFSNGTKVGEQTRFRNINDTFSFSWLSTAAGTYQLTARFTASNGAVAVTAPVAVRVNASAPAGPSVATFYADCEYGGKGVALAPGNYDQAQLAALGIGTNISSFKVNSAYKVELYGNGNFSSEYLGLAGDQACLVGIDPSNAPNNSGLPWGERTWNDAVRSLRIVPASVPFFTPVIDILSPSQNAAFTAPAAINIVVRAGLVRQIVNKIEFYNGTTLLGTLGDDKSALTWTTISQFTYKWTGVPAGTHVLTAKAYVGSNSAVSAPVTIHVTGAGNAGLVSQASKPAADTKHLLAVDATHNTLDVITASPANITSLALYRFSGRLAKTVSGMKQVRIDDLPDGVYFVVIQDSNGGVQKEKVLIQR